MPLDIIGAGFGRTGTLSLKIALELLGFGKCYHMMEVMKTPGHFEYWRRATRGEPVDWSALFTDYRATMDWPACTYWETYRACWPGARVILSLRDPKLWYRSVRTTIYPASKIALHLPSTAFRTRAEWEHDLIWNGTFGGRITDEEYVVGLFNAHNNKVRAAVPASHLLIYEPGDGWDPLCDFLGVERPDIPFPHVNKAEDFPRQWAGLATGRAPS